MKILTITIPCYNSAAYMKKAIDYAVMGGDDVEVIVVDDGSSDNTLEIAKDYEARYPGIVRAVHQENKGHGGAVNTGLKLAQGIFFKVCDSDDHLSYDAYMKALDVLREVVAGPTTLDALICNYVYDKQGAKRKRMMRYTGSFPEGRIFTWNEMEKPLNRHRYVLMHSLVYRTQLLRESGLKLPEHTFYVDNLVAFQPIMYVKTLYYLNEPLYMYYIGREDQSVNEETMMRRIDQQLKVNRIMIESWRPELVKNRNQSEFLSHYLSIILTISSILLIKIGTDEALEKKKELWDSLKRKDLILYLRMRHCFLGRIVNIPGKAGRDMAVQGYKLTQKFYGFN